MKKSYGQQGEEITDIEKMLGQQAEEITDSGKMAMESR